MAGWRCAECVGCGRCLEAWRLADGDVVTGATNWAEAFKALDDGSAGAPPPCPAPAGAPGPGVTSATGAPDAEGL